MVEEKAKPNTAGTKEAEVISINLEPLLMPLAIVLASIILAIGMVISANVLKGSVGNSPTAVAPIVDTAGAGTGTVAAKTTIDDDPILGNKDTAKVAIVEFSDYECPFCKRHFEETHPEIIKNYVDTGKAIIVFRDYPLSFHDPLASYQANAAECVQDQLGDKKYYEYHDLLFKTSKSNGNGMTKEQVVELGKQVGVNEATFKACVESEKFKAEVQKDMADGTAAGISGTPGFIIGKFDGTNVDGVNISGAMPYATFQKALDEQLAR
jgi:protein-disulfide isomerase